MPLGNDQTLNIVLRVKDEASKQIDGLRGKLSNLSKTMQPATNASKSLALALTGAGVAAGAAAAALGTMAVKAAMDAEVEMARFHTTMKTIEGATQASTDAILERASALRTMGFDDEEAANVMAQLYQRTGDLNEAFRLNALAMDLARAKNVSLAEAGNMIQMVLSGNARALKQYGIEISDTLPPLEALGELQTKVAGQADAFSQTFQGQVTAMNLAWNDFLETVGERLIPIITKVLVAITPLLAALLDVDARIQDIIAVFEDFQPLIIAVAGAIAGALTPAILFSLIPAVFSLIAAFAAGAVALAPWILGGMIVAGIVAGILWIAKNWDYVASQLEATWVGIKLMFKDAVNFMVGIAEGWANTWVKAANIIIGALNKVKFSIPDWVPGIGGKSFGINIPLVPEVKLPRFEHGGIVPGARGEAVPIIAHGQERILPAGSSAAAAAPSYSVVINNPVVRSQDDLNAMRRMIEDALRDVTRGHKLATI